MIDEAKRKLIGAPAPSQAESNSAANLTESVERGKRQGTADAGMDVPYIEVEPSLIPRKQ